MNKICVESQIQRLPPEKISRITSQMVSPPPAPLIRNTKRSTPKARRKQKKQYQSIAMGIWIT